MFEWLAQAIRQTGSKYCFTLRPPATEPQVAAAEKALNLKFPDDFRYFLIHCHDGGIFFHDEGNLYSSMSFHVYSSAPGATEVPYGLVRETLQFRQTHGKDADGLVVFGYTPGPGAFHLALDVQTGAVLDLYGLRRKDWVRIANRFEELLNRMFGNLEKPLFWI